MCMSASCFIWTGGLEDTEEPAEEPLALLTKAVAYCCAQSYAQDFVGWAMSSHVKLKKVGRCEPLFLRANGFKKNSLALENPSCLPCI